MTRSVPHPRRPAVPTRPPAPAARRPSSRSGLTLPYRTPLSVLGTALCLLLAGLFLPGAVAAQETPGRTAGAPLVYIDPGHGGEVSGVVADGIHEKDLVLRWGFLLAEAFAAAGYETHMSRTGDVTRSFQERVDEAAALGAVVFLSLHINGDDDPGVWGTELFLAEDVPESVAAAESIAAALESIGARVTLIGQPWEVLRSGPFPTVMIELGHLTNPVERRLVTSPAFWAEASRAIVTAVDEGVAPR